MAHKKPSIFISFFILSIFFLDVSQAVDIKRSPSFDCSGDISISQKVICDSAYLSSLDFELSTHIDGLRQLLTRTQYLVEARTFVEKRVECGDDVGCLTQIYESRLWRVRSRVNDLNPVEGSWVNDEHASISIVKIASKYRLIGTSPGPIEAYCNDEASKVISRSVQFDKWDMRKNGFNYAWSDTCVWIVRIVDNQLNINITQECIEEDGFFAGDFRKGESSDLAYVCFEQ